METQTQSSGPGPNTVIWHLGHIVSNAESSRPTGHAPRYAVHPQNGLPTPFTLKFTYDSIEAANAAIDAMVRMVFESEASRIAKGEPHWGSDDFHAYWEHVIAQLQREGKRFPDNESMDAACAMIRHRHEHSEAAPRPRER